MLPSVSTPLPLLGVLVAALLAALVAWPARHVSTGVLAFGLLLGLTASLLGTVLAVAPYPWTDLIVLAVALCGGLVLGRVLPTAFLPFFLVLALCSVLDVLLVALKVDTAPAAAGPVPIWLHYADITLGLPGWRFEAGASRSAAATCCWLLPWPSTGTGGQARCRLPLRPSLSG